MNIKLEYSDTQLKIVNDHVKAGNAQLSKRVDILQESVIKLQRDLTRKYKVAIRTLLADAKKRIGDHPHLFTEEEALVIIAKTINKHTEKYSASIISAAYILEAVESMTADREIFQSICMKTYGDVQERDDVDDYFS